MAYNVEWRPHTQAECVKEAERHAGDAPLGYLYRFTDQTYASSDPWGDGDHYEFRTCIEIEAFPIRRRTPCGWTIKDWNARGWRFVSEHSVKRFALPTIDEALHSFIKRKERQASIYEARAAKARYAITLLREPFAPVVAERVKS